jgi:hypothetical protein
MTKTLLKSQNFSAHTTKESRYFVLFLETCSNFDAEIRFFDKNDIIIVDVDLSISINFDLSNPEIDYRSITVNQANLLLDPTGSATLYINEAADPCYYL